jgi:hypothetical protein
MGECKYRCVVKELLWKQKNKNLERDSTTADEGDSSSLIGFDGFKRG